MNLPAELKYTKDHEWVLVDGDVAIVGITDFAQKELGDVVFVEISCSEGDELEAGEVFGSVEAVKTVSDLFLPVSGEVLELNAELDDNPELVNTDPYQKGWMLKVKIADPAEVEGLLSADAYKEFIGA